MAAGIEAPQSNRDKEQGGCGMAHAVDMGRVSQARAKNKNSHMKAAAKWRVLCHIEMVEILISRFSLKRTDVRISPAICVDFDWKGPAWISASSHPLRPFGVLAWYRSLE